jgi:hypothetical protein
VEILTPSGVGADKDQGDNKKELSQILYGPLTALCITERAGHQKNGKRTKKAQIVWTREKSRTGCTKEMEGEIGVNEESRRS